MSACEGGERERRRDLKKESEIVRRERDGGARSKRERESRERRQNHKKEKRERPQERGSVRTRAIANSDDATITSER